MNRGRRRALGHAIFIALPVVVWAEFLILVSKNRWLGDFAIFRLAGKRVLHGQSPYVSPTVELLAENDKFVYPTPFAIPFIPFALLPASVANGLFLAVSFVSILAAIWLLGVRDYRCYGIALLWPPLIGAVLLGAIGPLLLLLVAAAWRFRDHLAAAVLLALAAFAKLFLWPLPLWLLATRRYRQAIAAVVTGAVVLLAWALIDLQGLQRYPATVRTLNEVQRATSYSPQSLLIALDEPAALAIGASFGLALVGVVCIWLVARRPGGERAAYALAVLVALAATPILWHHYLVLLIAPVALAAPRFGVLWALPLLLYVTPHPEASGSVWRIAYLLAIGAVMGAIVLARQLDSTWRPSRRRLLVPRRQE